jgi:hypothetical protein
MKIEVSNGEIVDKYTIIQIKLLHADPNSEKYVNLQNEYDVLNSAVDSIGAEKLLIDELYEVNKQLWVIEDKIRVLEQQKKFDQEFIELARAVYITNDKRYSIKQWINQTTKSKLVEEKILPIYKD